MASDTPQRTVLVGHDLDEIKPRVLAHGFTVVETHPDLIICHGGDGTLLGAERDWPGVPKLTLQWGKHSEKCERHTDDVVLTAVAAGQCTHDEYTKIEAVTGDRRLVGINEIVVHNRTVTSAVRHCIWIDDVALTHEVVGDGLVAATPFGSSGYYRSITKSTFQLGIGLAFNNSMEPLDHIVLRPEAVIRVRITRGPALLVCDNNPEEIALERDGEVTIRTHDQGTVILMAETLTCPHCQRHREGEGRHVHTHLRPDHRGGLSHA